MSEPLQPAEVTTTATTAPSAARSPRWRRALLYLFATIGALAVGVIALAYLTTHAAKGIDPASVSVDELIDQTMTRHYGRYDAELKAWVRPDPKGNGPLLMRVIHRAKMESQDADGRPVLEAVYFLASGEEQGVEGMQTRRLGLFAFRPDTRSGKAQLVEISDAEREVYTVAAVRPEDVRFEALSADTNGWIIKLTRAAEAAPTSRFVTDLVVAPRGDTFAELANFTAKAQYTPELGCARAAAAHRMAQEDLARQRQAREAERAARAASGASAPEEDDPEDMANSEDEEEPPGTEMCSDATWTYKTGALGDGFVDLLVTGGGLVNGRELPKKTYKLVFDPKGNSYVVPDELTLF